MPSSTSWPNNTTTTSYSSRKHTRFPRSAGCRVVSYHSATSCLEPHCLLACSNNTAHTPSRARAALYIKNTIPHARVDLCGLQSEHLECVAVTTYMGAVETTMVSAYMKPNWDPAELCSLTALRVHDKIVCGDLNTHHVSWESRRAMQTPPAGSLPSTPESQPSSNGTTGSRASTSPLCRTTASAPGGRRPARGVRTTRTSSSRQKSLGTTRAPV